jgi:hypothetical protein
VAIMWENSRQLKIFKKDIAPERTVAIMRARFSTIGGGSKLTKTRQSFFIWLNVLGFVSRPMTIAS